MAGTVRGRLELASVIFLPCQVSPHKSGTTASSEDRLEMLRLALSEIGDDAFGLDRFEIDEPGPSYSWKTAEHFTAAEPEVEWHWIVGTDQWNALHRWAEPEILREKLHFIVCTRGDDQLVDRPGWRHTEVAFRHPASSTAIRGDFEGHLDWLCDAVVGFCRQKRLYGANPTRVR